MKSLSAALRIEKNKLATDSPWLVLLKFTLGANIVYICNNNEDVVFGGDTYVSFPFSIATQVETYDGSLPTVDLQVSNVSGAFQQYLELLDGAIGATVDLHVVNTAHLSEDFSSLDMTFSILRTKSSREWIGFTLGASNPLRRRYPKYQYLRNSCNWQFKGVECAYVGADTVCTRTYQACIDKSNTPRFGGYRGLMGNALRLV